MGLFLTYNGSVRLKVKSWISSSDSPARWPRQQGVPLCARPLWPPVPLSACGNRTRRMSGWGRGPPAPAPARPAPPSTFFPWKYSDITPSYLLAGSFVNSFMPCRRQTMGPAAGWRRRRGGRHLSQDNFFMSCGPKASVDFKAGTWVNFLGVGLCGLRCHSPRQKKTHKVKCVSNAGLKLQISLEF